MSNHFHLLMTPAIEQGIPKFMLKLATSYASYFNKKYTRTGSLFESSYKAKYVDSDQYLKYLFSYIHLNPFRDKDENIKNYIDDQQLSEFVHSSLPDYLGEERPCGKIINPERFPRYFTEISSHRRELREWLDFK